MEMEVACGIAEDCIILGDEVADRLIAEQTTFSGLSAAFIARANQSMKSVCILSKLGFVGDAMSAGRTVVEMSIDLAYIATDPQTLCAKFERHDDVKAFKFAKAVARLHGSSLDSEAMVQLKERHDQVIRDDPGTTRNWAGRSLAERAKVLGVDPIFETMYSLSYADMCNASHSGYSTLRYVMSIDEDNSEILFGPSEPSCKPIELACASLVAMIDTICNKHDYVEFENRLVGITNAIKHAYPDSPSDSQEA